jgi:hypothetical protein
MQSRGAMAFEQLLEILAAAAARRLDIRELRCAVLGSDEGRLLQLLRLLQCGQLAEAAAILSDLLPASAVRLAMGPAQALAAALAEAGLSLPFRHVENAASAPRWPIAQGAVSGSNLIH